MHEICHFSFIPIKGPFHDSPKHTEKSEKSDKQDVTDAPSDHVFDPDDDLEVEELPDNDRREPDTKEVKHCTDSTRTE